MGEIKTENNVKDNEKNVDPSGKETREIKENQDTSSILTKIKKKLYQLVITTNSFVRVVINKLIPSYEPRIEIEKKLVPGEIAKDNTLIRHFSEMQILIGFIVIILGIFAGSIISLYAYLVLLLGFILVITGFDIEEIYITSKRMLIRHIGFIERIIRIPSDEEHLLEHVVSFTVGRAPMNGIVVFLGASGFLLLLGSGLDGSVQFIIVLVSIAIMVIGLRLGKRILTINLAGGHQVILGVRKGIPTHILQSMMETIYQTSTDLNTPTT
ncbi:MAG: hypothetical protein ACXAD7_26950 [Candidatus Kariarchaeaceae archaeon]|jgi:hypothetical protein